MQFSKTDKRFASTLARGLSILRVFRPNDNGLGNLEISERTGIPRSTVSRLTFTLCALGYLTHGRRHDKYRLGPAALALGNIAAASFSFIEAATPIMQALANETGTLTGVAIQDDSEMLMVKTWRPVDSMSIWLDVGYRMPMLSSSSGAAYLGALGKDEFDQFTAALPERLSEHVDEYSVLRQESQNSLLTSGFAFIRGESRFTTTINAMAAPYRPSEFANPVVILCGAGSSVLTDEMICDTVGPALVQAMLELQRATGQQYSNVVNIH